MSDGAGRVYKRGNVWWIDYHHRGERYRESSGSHRKKDATALLKKRLAECGKSGPRVDEEKITFADLREIVENDYKANGRKSLPTVQRAFDHLSDTFKGWRAVDITTDRIKAHIAARKEEGAANSTINKELAALKRAFSLMEEAARLSRAPHVPKLKTNNTRENFLTMGDVEAVCEEIGPDLAPVVRFAALTGWRKSEVLGLRWRQVDWEGGVVRLDPGTTKNDDGRTFPFDALPPLERLLRHQRERTDKVERRKGEIVSHVFHRDGKRIKSLRGAWKGATKRAGVEGAWFHDLRRTAVRNLERAGLARSVAKSLTGHKTDSVYDRYAIADEASQREGVGKLAAHLDGMEGERSAIPLQEAQAAS